MQIEKYSCIVETPIQVTGRVRRFGKHEPCVGQRPSMALRGSVNHICTNGWSTKSGLKRGSFVTMSLLHFRRPVRKTPSSICTVRHNKQSFAKSSGSPTAGRSFANSTCPLSAAMQISNTSPCISTECFVHGESGRRVRGVVQAEPKHAFIAIQ